MRITKKKALQLLARAVEEKGRDYEMNAVGRYVDGDKPACIVGHVFNYIDPGILEQIMDKGLNFAGVNHVLKNVTTSHEFSKPAIEILDTAQRWQDGRTISHDCRWGRALDEVMSL
jgi:hypothetical protein